MQKHIMDNLSAVIAEEMLEMISSEAIARQFILEELDAARQGSEVAQDFVRVSGFERQEYIGAMKANINEIEALQDYFLRRKMQVAEDMESLVAISLSVVDYIMAHWKLGKYSPKYISQQLEFTRQVSEENNKRFGKTNNGVALSPENILAVVEKIHNIPEGALGNASNDLGEYASKMNSNTEDKLRLMAYAYARRTCAAGLYLQGVFNRAEYKHAADMFRRFQYITIQTPEFQIEACKQANEFLASYDSRITKQICNIMTTIVERGQTPCIKDIGQYQSFNIVITALEKASRASK